MPQPYKVRKQYMYTEVECFDAEGRLCDRERVVDDHLWDESAPEPLDEQERADFIDYFDAYEDDE